MIGRKWLIILPLLGVPMFTHEAWHATTDPRSPLITFYYLFAWATPLFNEAGEFSQWEFITVHILVNACTIVFMGLTFWLLGRVIRNQRSVRPEDLMMSSALTGH
jgi:hypothetical protein